MTTATSSTLACSAATTGEPYDSPPVSLMSASYDSARGAFRVHLRLFGPCTDSAAGEQVTFGEDWVAGSPGVCAGDPGKALHQRTQRICWPMTLPKEREVSTV